MAGATKVPIVGELSHKHNAWVGGTFFNRCINVTQERIASNKISILN